MARETIAPRAVRIDKLWLKHSYHGSAMPAPAVLADGGFFVNPRRDGGYYATRKVAGEPYVEINRRGVGTSTVKVQFNPAKLSAPSGFSSQTDEDIEAALDAVDDLVRSCAALEFDARSAVVQRYDAHADFDLEDEALIRPFLESASCSDPYLLRAPYGENTVYFQSRSKRRTRCIAVYGKFEESGELLAAGLLRVEPRLLTTGEVRKWAKSLPAGVPLFSVESARLLVGSALSKIHFDHARVREGQRNDLLLREFGLDALQLIGLISLQESHGAQFWDGHFSRSTFQKLKAKLKAAHLGGCLRGDFPALALAA